MDEDKKERFKQLVIIGAALLLMGWFIWFGLFPPFREVWILLEVAFVLSFMRQLKIAVGFS